MRQAWENGVVERVFTTDMTYRSPELLSSPWYTSIPMADDLALLITALNHDASLSRLLAPAKRIAALVKRHTTRVGARKSLDHRQISFSDLQQ
jgi:ribose-phosphate pyrophosphokinase